MTDLLFGCGSRGSDSDALMPLCKRCGESVSVVRDRITSTYMTIRGRRFCFDCGRYLMARRVKFGLPPYKSAFYGTGLLCQKQ